MRQRQYPFRLASRLRFYATLSISGLSILNAPLLGAQPASITEVNSAAQKPTWSTSALQQIEYDALQQEVALLQQTIKDAEEEHRRATEDLEAERRQLQDKRLRLQQNVRSMESALRTSSVAESRQAQNQQRTLAKTNALLTTALGPAWTEKYKIQSEGFDAWIEKLNKHRGLWTSQEQVFDNKGIGDAVQTLHIGNVIAFASGRHGGGLQPLAPTESSFQMVDAPRSIGLFPKRQRAFVFNPRLRSQPIHGTTLSGLLDAGGWVMWPIAGLALLGLFMLVERFWTLSRLGWALDTKVKKVVRHIEQGDWTQAESLVAKPNSAIEHVLANILKHRQLQRADQEDRASEMVLRLRPKLERFQSALSVIAGVAPLLGLLGTVTGMIATFWVLKINNDADPNLLSGGISQALLTTQFGLIVAVPAVLFSAVLSRWSEFILAKLQLGALKALNSLQAQGSLPASASS